MRTRQAAKLEAATSRSEGSGSVDETCHVFGSEKDASPQLPDVITVNNSGDSKHQLLSLSSCLDPGPQSDLYFSCDPDMEVEDNVLPPHTQRSKVAVPHKGVRKDCVISPDFEQRECAPPIKISRYAHKKMAKVCRVLYIRHYLY